MNRTLVTLMLPACLFVTQAFGADQSTPEERSRLVNIAKQLESDPAAPALHSDRDWAIKFLIQAPDVHVVLCAEATNFLLKKKHYKYAPDLMALATIEGGRFDIEHPKQPDAAQAKAMVEGALKGYEALLKSDPKAQLKEADEMLAKRDTGQLDAYFVGACTNKSN